MNKGIAIAWTVGLCVSIVAALSAIMVPQGKVAYSSTRLTYIPEDFVRTGEGVAGASISGKVIDANGPVAGATVRVQATENSTVSAQDGSFTLSGLSSGDPVTVTAWAAGYYNGVAFGQPGQSPLTITLTAHFATDNHLYDWFVLDGAKGSMACGVCHTAYSEWQADAHGQSATNPRFLSMYAGTDVHGNISPQPEKTSLGIPLPPDFTQAYYGPGFVLDFPNRAGNCATCHTPVAAKMPNNKNCGWSGCHASSTSAQSYGLDPGVSPMPLTGNAAEGISCEFCHKIGDVYIRKESGLPYEDSPGILSVRLYRPTEGHDIFFGPLDDVIGNDATSIKDSYLPLMKESVFCAGCHYGVMGGVVGKDGVTGGVLVYNSYGEWLESPYSDPETGQTCQDCHMPAMESGYFVYPEQGGMLDRDGSQIHNHQMPGASDTQLLQNSVTLSATALVKDEWLWVNVNIVNDRVGHHVPTDSPLRQMLLVVEAKDKDGHSIPLAYGPELPEWAGDLGGLPGKAFAKVLQDEWTGEMPTGAIWRPVRIVADTRLPALKSDHSMYTFSVQDAEAITVEVRLVYRRAYQQLAESKGWNDPDILMAQQTLQVQPSQHKTLW